MTARRQLALFALVKLALLVTGFALWIVALVLKDRDGPLHYAGEFLLVGTLLWVTIDQWRETRRRLREDEDTSASRDTR